MSLRVLHVIPTSAVEPSLRFHGSTKDIRCRTEYFHSRGIRVDELVVNRTEEDIVHRLSGIDLDAFDAVFMDMCHSYPKALFYIGRRAPRLKILSRSINAEPYHRLEWLSASPGWKGKARSAVKAAMFLLKDVLAGLSRGWILPISDSDADQYWRYLTSEDRTRVVPFFVPAEYIPAAVRDSKDDLCVCSTSVEMNPLIADAVAGFNAAVSGAGPTGWTFAITGRTGALGPLHPSIRPMGLLGSPFEVLNRAKAVAVLSDLGRGFKTKILEAIVARCYVLVTPALFERLPREVRPFCFVVVPGDAASFRRALERCQEPFPAFDANGALRARAYRVLDALLETGPVAAAQPREEHADPLAV